MALDWLRVTISNCVIAYVVMCVKTSSRQWNFYKQGLNVPHNSLNSARYFIFYENMQFLLIAICFFVISKSYQNPEIYELVSQSRSSFCCPLIAQRTLVRHENQQIIKIRIFSIDPSNVIYISTDVSNSKY